MENARKGKRKKGQMSMLVFVLGVVFFIMMGIFLFTSSINPPNTEYVNLYVHNLLLSTLRSGTGYPHPCLSVSDTLSCAYLTPNRLCGNSACSEIAVDVTKKPLENIIKSNYGYYLIVEPDNWDMVGGSRITVGQESVEDKHPHYVANEKVLAYGSNLRIKLILAKN